MNAEDHSDVWRAAADELVQFAKAANTPFLADLALFAITVAKQYSAKALEGLQKS